MSLACSLTALLVISDFIYISRKGYILSNISLSVIGFLTLCLYLIFNTRNNLFVGRSWILVFPMIAFYTQSLKRSLVLIGICFIALLANWILDLDSTSISIRLNTEQIIVFALISFITFVYSRSSDQKTNQMKQMLLQNNLTLLPNRKALQLDITDKKFRAIAIINMDGFKSINNLYGIKVGDQLLIEISDKLKKLLYLKNGYKLYKLH
ncbi:MAG: diguanylate cyclase, partial [Spirochaetales bacterium]|nr:diguanylate cyclase [Spirochaetales bacterium]